MLPPREIPLPRFGICDTRHVSELLRLREAQADCVRQAWCRLSLPFPLHASGSSARSETETKCHRQHNSPYINDMAYGQSQRGAQASDPGQDHLRAWRDTTATVRQSEGSMNDSEQSPPKQQNAHRSSSHYANNPAAARSRDRRKEGDLSRLLCFASSHTSVRPGFSLPSSNAGSIALIHA